MSEETAQYRFLSEVRAFLAKLLKDPINAQPSKYLKDRNFNRAKLINVLIKRGVVERHEKILDSTNSDEKKAKYVVRFKVRKKNFERNIEKIFIKYFEKNEPEKKSVNECEGGDGGGCMGDGGGATSTCSAGDYGYVAPFGEVQRRAIGASLPKKNKKDVDPTKILGKDIKAEGKKPRLIRITEEQYRILTEEEAAGTTTFSVSSETSRGDVGYDANAFGKNKAGQKGKPYDEDFWKESLIHNKKGGISCERIK